MPKVLDDALKRRLAAHVNGISRAECEIQLSRGPLAEEMETFTAHENLSLLVRDALLRADFMHELRDEIARHAAFLQRLKELLETIP